MKNEDYMAVQNAIINVGKLIMGIPLDEFIDEMKHAEAMGPTVDPTLFRLGIDRLRALKQLAEDVQRVQKSFYVLHQVVNTAISNEISSEVKGVLNSIEREL